MFRLTLIILLFILLFSSLRKKQMDTISKRFVLTFLIVWAIGLIGSFFNSQYLGHISTLTYVLLCLNVVAFYLGFSHISYDRDSKTLYDSFATGVDTLSRNTAFRIIISVLCIYVFSLLIIYAGRVAALQSLGDLRAEYYENNIYGPLYSILRPYVLSPVSFIAMPVFGYLLLNDRKNLSLYLTGFFLIGSMSLSGGRFGYFRLFMAVFFTMYVINTTFKMNRKYIMYFVLVTVIFFTAISYITSARKGYMTMGENDNAQSDMIDAVSSYVTGPIAAFNYAIENDDVQLVGGYKYGRLTISPVEQLINNVLSRIGIYTEPALNRVAEVKQNRLVYFGDSSYNALYTAAYIFYLDFGILGVILIPFIIGFLFRKTIILCYQTNSYWHIVLMFWCFIKVINSIFDYGFYDKTELFLIIVLWFCGYKYMLSYSSISQKQYID